MNPPTDNEGVDEQLAEIQRLKRQQYDEDLLGLMAMPLGRRVMARLVWDTAKLERPSFTADPYTTAYNEGQRSVGYFLMAECRRVAPIQFIDMQEERLKDDHDLQLRRHLAGERAKEPG